jgi:hypothetical protein
MRTALSSPLSGGMNPTPLLDRSLAGLPFTLAKPLSAGIPSVPPPPTGRSCHGGQGRSSAMSAPCTAPTIGLASGAPQSGAASLSARSTALDEPLAGRPLVVATAPLPPDLKSSAGNRVGCGCGGTCKGAPNGPSRGVYDASPVTAHCTRSNITDIVGSGWWLDRGLTGQPITRATQPQRSIVATAGRREGRRSCGCAKQQDFAAPTPVCGPHGFVNTSFSLSEGRCSCGSGKQQDFAAPTPVCGPHGFVNTSSSLAQRYVFPGGADQQLPSPPPAPPMEETAASAPGGSSALTCQECLKQPCTSPTGGPVNLGFCLHRCDTACGIKPPVPPPTPPPAVAALGTCPAYPAGFVANPPYTPPPPPLPPPPSAACLDCRKKLKTKCQNPAPSVQAGLACLASCNTVCPVAPPAPAPGPIQPILDCVLELPPVPASGGTAARCKTCLDNCNKNPPMPITVGKYGTVSQSDICKTKCGQDCSPPVPGHRVFRAYFGYNNPGPPQDMRPKPTSAGWRGTPPSAMSNNSITLSGGTLSGCNSRPVDFFKAGLHEKAFAIDFIEGQSVTWNLLGQTVTASASSTCPPFAYHGLRPILKGIQPLKISGGGFDISGPIDQGIQAVLPDGLAGPVSAIVDEAGTSSGAFGVINSVVNAFTGGGGSGGGWRGSGSGVPGPFTAIFGYENTGAAIHIPVGADNRTTPVERPITGISPHHSGQPTWFETGLHPWEFRINSLGSPVSWTLAGTCVTATKDSPQVPVTGFVPLDKTFAQGCGDFLKEIPVVKDIPIVSDIFGHGADASNLACQTVEGLGNRITQPWLIPEWAISAGLGLVASAAIRVQVTYAQKNAYQIPESLKDILMRLIQPDLDAGYGITWSRADLDAARIISANDDRAGLVHAVIPEETDAMTLENVIFFKDDNVLNALLGAEGFPGPEEFFNEGAGYDQDCMHWRSNLREGIGRMVHELVHIWQIRKMGAPYAALAYATQHGELGQGGSNFYCHAWQEQQAYTYEAKVHQRTPGLLLINPGSTWGIANLGCPLGLPPWTPP